MSSTNITGKKLTCYHCGEDCIEEIIVSQEKNFCCPGCKMVFEIINQNGLCEYYNIEENPGINQKAKVRSDKFAILDNEGVNQKLVHFRDGQQHHITFYLPQMHCSSCIWLLEKLPGLNKNIIKSTVNFLKKEVTVIFNSDGVSLRELAELLTRLGYEPHISLHDIDSSKIKKFDRSKIYKIGVSGFCFGNIMLLSFPEYFSSGDIHEEQLKHIFNFLNLGLSLPVFFYCASGFFVSAYKGLRQKFLNIDAPIALAVLIAFVRSVYEIVSFTGAGFLDSMSGIVFFMLIGRFFQDKTYQSLSFNRDYTSYFPIGVTVIRDSGKEVNVPVSDIKKGDRIRIHSHEIIPADGMLFMGTANIDYSFVNGESRTSQKSIGEIIYAGGKQVGGAIELEVVKEVSQSYLTQLWNNDIFKKTNEKKKVSFVHKVSRYFTYILFTIAILTAAYWTIFNPANTWNAVTAILIVACPCALLLSATFTNGNMMAVLHRHDFFIRNSGVLEEITEADTIVFDKTGTLSIQGEGITTFEQGALSPYEKQLVRSLAAQSNHPLSKILLLHLPVQKQLKVKSFVEEKGRGSSGMINNELVKIGSQEFITSSNGLKLNGGSTVYVSINNEVLGYFKIKTEYRQGIHGIIPALKNKYRLALISGDNDSEESYLRNIFGSRSQLLFNRTPQEKLDYIKNLQAIGRKVIMIGDGLNDAGALQQSNVGIAITDDINNFSPGCDAILDGKQFSKLEKLLDYCRKQKNIIYGSFIISILYNIVGLFFAVQGTLSPVIAAILMPVSSITIVLYTTIISNSLSKRIKA